MLHKLGYAFICERCNQPVPDDYIGDGENNWCEACRDKWIAQEYARLKPLYDASKEPSS